MTKEKQTAILISLALWLMLVALGIIAVSVTAQREALDRLRAQQDATASRLDRVELRLLPYNRREAVRK